VDEQFQLGVHTVEWIIRVIMLFVVPTRRSPTAAKVWLLLVFFQPIVGVVVFFIFGSNKTPRWRREQLKKLPNALKPLRESLRGNPELLRLSDDVDTHFTDEVDLARKLGNLPLLGGNEVEILTDYNKSIDRLIEDINAAKTSVHLVYYIFYPDKTGRKVADALKAAARRGVECRLLLDAVGSRKALGKMAKELRKSGVHVMDILPFGFFRKRAARFDLRNHRKIAVIDGKIGYIGSQNIINSEPVDGLVFQELVTRITGPVVWQFQFLFISDWFLETDELLDGIQYFPQPDKLGRSSLQTLPSGPDFPFMNSEMVLLSLVHSARQRICMVTPYFIPDDPILAAVETAAVKGVQVTLIVSQIADSSLVSLAQRSYYERLLEAGVRIFLYKKKFLHAKHVTIDDSVMTLGSYNIDIRSFTLNAELMVLGFDKELTARIVAVENYYLTRCNQLTLAAWQARPLIAKVGENLARLFSPLL